MESKRSSHSTGVEAVEWRQVAVLSGFSADINEKELSEGIQLRRLTNDDYCFLRALTVDRVDGVANYWWNLERESAEFCFLAKPKLSPPASMAASNARSKFERIVTCLRLLQPGAVKIVALACWPTNQPAPKDSPNDEADGDLTTPYGPPLVGAGYHLRQESADKLVSLMSRLQDGLSDSCIRTALSFFNQTYEYFRTKTMLMGFEGIDWPREIAAKQDKLIRLWMCLEALLIARRERNEIGSSVARRAELLLDKQSGDTLRKSWESRCEVVHGEDPRELDTVLGMTEKVTRGLLVRAIEDPQNLRLIRPA